jgi:hypothetical protein
LLSLRSVFVLYPNNSDRFYFITGDLLLLFSDDLLLPKTAGAKLLFTPFFFSPHLQKPIENP